MTLPPATRELRYAQVLLAMVNTIGYLGSFRLPRLGVAASICATSVAWAAGLTSEPFLVAALALFLYAQRRPNSRFPRLLLVAGALLLLAALVLAVDQIEHVVRYLILSAMALGSAWGFGLYVGLVRLEEQDRARLEERLRLSGEVHDLLSHSLGTIGVRAGVATHVQRPDSELRETLRDIELTARSGVQQLQGLLTRELDQGSPAMRPANNEKDWSLLTEVQDIVAACEKASLEVRLEYDETVEDLSESVRTTIKRTILELATNVIRHAEANTVQIRVTRQNEFAVVHVMDDGTGSMSRLGPGHGLTLMRQRLQMLDGTIRFEDREVGGLSVTARIPIDQSETE